MAIVDEEVLSGNSHFSRFDTDHSAGLGQPAFGTACSLDANGQMKVLHTFGQGSTDGEEPGGGLVDVAGTFYGVTFYGGTVNSTCSFGCGVVYRVTDSGKYSVVYRFSGAADGWLPSGGLTEDRSGNLYGATILGGNGSGVIFKIAP